MNLPKGLNIEPEGIYFVITSKEIIEYNGEELLNAIEVKSELLDNALLYQGNYLGTISWVTTLQIEQTVSESGPAR